VAVTIIMPQLGDFMTEGVIARWHKKPGESVQQGEVIAEIESEKMTYDLEAVAAGIFHPVVAEGASATVDGTIAFVLKEGESPPEEMPTKPAVKRTDRQASSTPSRSEPIRGLRDVVPSTPGARRLAAKLDVDISEVTPSGPRGRVVESDVRAHAEAGDAPPAGPAIPAGVPPPSEINPLSGMRKAVAERMRTSIASTAQLSFFLEVDITEAQRLRYQFSDDPAVVLTMPHVLIKACVSALQKVPGLNTILSDGNILVFDEINVGVAVALENGLVVPVIRNAGKMSIFEISDTTHNLAVKARESSLSPDATTGGTFTISVLGTVDGFTPILNPGQTAILGAGRIVQKPAAIDGQVVIREVMMLSLTVDHQVVDGALAARFMECLEKTLKSPANLFE
jgi:pyruvate dehydrogenase E2 component (dihydrolipoamide acetyltransferase)